MDPRILGVKGPLQGVLHSLREGEISVGRDPSNRIWTGDPALSRRHCLITGSGDQFSICDLESRNGTFLNGTAVRTGRLSHGDRISVGESVLVFLVDGDPVDLERGTVEMAETAELDCEPVLLFPQDAFYLQPDKLVNAVSDKTRLARDLNSLLKIATGIGGIRDADSLQWQLLGFIFDVVPADRGAVLLFDRPDQLNSSVAWDRVRGPGSPVRVSRTIVRQVAEGQAGLVVSDVPSNKQMRAVGTLRELGVRSVLCVPLLVSRKVFGVIYLDARNPRHPFDRDHLQVMTGVAGIASLAFDNVRHWERLQQENRDLRAEIALEHDMVGSSAQIREVFDFIRRVAPTEATVLIQGESGTGKELVARAIHRNSERAEQPFVAINCAAIAESLLETEMFGHEKGAFTGAISQKKGKIEIAEGGTLFLDEVGELAPGLQAKLLRVLQEREFDRVGGTRPIKLDIRVIVATNRSLADAVKAGTFRSDLYYRLNVVAITVPPLRERREDIAQMVDHFIGKVSHKHNSRGKTLSPEARICLVNYDWPGNVRELENAIERALVLGTTETILPDDLPEAIVESAMPSAAAVPHYHVALMNFKKQLVAQALQQASGSYLEAAKFLGVHPNSLLRLIRNLGLKGTTKSGPAA